MSALYKLYLVWFAAGVVLLGFDLIPPQLEWANSVFLILSGAVALGYAMATFGRQKGLIISALIFVTTFVIEGFSAKFDMFFGNYDYTDRFPPLLFGVPIGIGFAWITMIMAGHALTVGVKQPVLRALLAALYAVVLDCILDPVAFVVKEYWLWEGTSAYYDIPYSNFVGWFVIAIGWQLYLALQESTLEPTSRRQVVVVFWTMVALFSFVGVLSGLYLALVVTFVGFVLLEIVRRWWHEKV